MNSELEPSNLSAFEAVVGRRSVRGFLRTPVEGAVVKRILSAAARAPSGMNTQPWCVHIVTNGSKERLSEAVYEAAGRGEGCLEYDYIPEPMKEPYLSRRRKVGFDLYAAYGIDRRDRTARERAFLQNYDFFGAPVGLFITMERELLAGSWLDLRNVHAIHHDRCPCVRTRNLPATSMVRLWRRGAEAVVDSGQIHPPVRDGARLCGPVSAAKSPGYATREA